MYLDLVYKSPLYKHYLVFFIQIVFIVIKIINFELQFLCRNGTNRYCFKIIKQPWQGKILQITDLSSWGIGNIIYYNQTPNIFNCSNTHTAIFISNFVLRFEANYCFQLSTYRLRSVRYD